MIREPIILKEAHPTNRSDLFWYRPALDLCDRQGHNIGLVDSYGAHEWSAKYFDAGATDYIGGRNQYSIKLPAIFNWQKGVTREVFIQNLLDNFPDHFEWFMWHPEWIGL